MSGALSFRRLRRRWRRHLVRLGRRLSLTAPRPVPERLDLLFGLAAIARYMGLTKGQVRRLVAQRAIPCFELDGVACARRSSIERHVRGLETMPGVE